MASNLQRLTLVFSLSLASIIAFSCKGHESIFEAEAEGIWQTEYFTDSSGEKTQNAFLVTDAIKGTCTSYGTSEAMLGFLYYREDDGEPIVGISFGPRYFGGMPQTQFTVSANGVDSFTFVSRYDDDLNRFNLKGKIAEKFIGIFTTADTLQVEAWHALEDATKESFSFETDSLSGFVPVYNRYERIFKKKHPDLEIYQKEKKK